MLQRPPTRRKIGKPKNSIQANSRPGPSVGSVRSRVYCSAFAVSSRKPQPDHCSLCVKTEKINVKTDKTKSSQIHTGTPPIVPVAPSLVSPLVLSSKHLAAQREDQNISTESSKESERLCEVYKPLKALHDAISACQVESSYIVLLQQWSKDAGGCLPRLFTLSQSRWRPGPMIDGLKHEVTQLCYVRLTPPS